jgi:hypothetical protein
MTERPIREYDVEEYLIKQCAKHGAVAEKFNSPQKSHVPDRLVMWPDRPRGLAAEITFVECKAPGKKPTVMQARDHDRRRELGFRVDVIDSYEGVDGYIRNMLY